MSSTPQIYFESNLPQISDASGIPRICLIVEYKEVTPLRNGIIFFGLAYKLYLVGGVFDWNELFLFSVRSASPGNAAIAVAHEEDNFDHDYSTVRTAPARTGSEDECRTVATCTAVTAFGARLFVSPEMRCCAYSARFVICLLIYTLIIGPHWLAEHVAQRRPLADAQRHCTSLRSPKLESSDPKPKEPQIKKKVKTPDPKCDRRINIGFGCKLWGGRSSRKV